MLISLDKMGFLNRWVISSTLGMICLIIASLYAIIKKKKRKVDLFYLVNAFILGLLIYPGINLIFYGFVGRSIYEESLIEYSSYIIIAGIILIAISIYGLLSLLGIKFKPKKNGNKIKKWKIYPPATTLSFWRNRGVS